LMNADRWRRAHEYHHERQNIHYQSLNQPGIVCGWGCG
jgi:fatty acid desaturase